MYNLIKYALYLECSRTHFEIYIVKINTLLSDIIPNKQDNYSGSCY